MSRILYLTQGYTLHDNHFLQKLAETSHDVYFLSCQPISNRIASPPLPATIHALEPLSNTTSPWTFYNWIVATFRLRQRLREIRPDLIHAGPVQEGGFLAALCRFHPLLVMSWGSDLLVRADQSAALRRRTAYTLRRTDLFFGDCQAVLDKAMTFAPFRADQTVSFPWGVESDFFKSTPSTLGLRASLKWGTDPVFIYTRGFEPIHAPMVFLAALKRVVAQHPEAKALLLGTGSLESEAKEFCRRNGLESHAHFAGQVDHSELAGYFKESDIYVSATLSDGSSISLLEAMACGRPAIVVDAYGNREWVRPGENGWLYPPGDPAALAQAMTEAVEKPDLRQAMGVKNLGVARAKADWDQNFSRLLAAYDRLLTRGTDS